jgi:hypothetical protein
MNETPEPEASGYGERLRAAELHDIADMMDELMDRCRMCDMYCGAEQREIRRLRGLFERYAVKCGLSAEEIKDQIDNP